MKRQIALCDLARNPGSIEAARLAPHCALPREERAQGSMRATRPRWRMMGASTTKDELRPKTNPPDWLTQCTGSITFLRFKTFVATLLIPKFAQEFRPTAK